MILEGSETEKQEIRDAFVRSCGNIRHVIDYVPFLVPGDEPRVQKIVDGLIKDGLMSNHETLKTLKDANSKTKPKRK